MGLTGAIGVESDLEVVAEASNAQEALLLFREHEPDITIMDVRLPEVSGIEATSSIIKEFPDAKIIMLSTFEHDEDIYRALQAGAQAYLPKNIDRDELLRSIRAVNQGSSFFPPQIATRLTRRINSAKLTSREMDVLKMLVNGLTNKQIASALSITEVTVKFHVSSIMEKLGAQDRTQAVTMAIRRGIIHID
jgi:DNA-binding NarL/FixJ family response regulator